VKEISPFLFSKSSKFPRIKGTSTLICLSSQLIQQLENYLLAFKAKFTTP